MTHFNRYFSSALCYGFDQAQYCKTRKKLEKMTKNAVFSTVKMEISQGRIFGVAKVAI